MGSPDQFGGTPNCRSAASVAPQQGLRFEFGQVGGIQLLAPALRSRVVMVCHDRAGIRVANGLCFRSGPARSETPVIMPRPAAAVQWSRSHGRRRCIGTLSGKAVFCKHVLGSRYACVVPAWQSPLQDPVLSGYTDLHARNMYQSGSPGQLTFA